MDRNPGLNHGPDHSYQFHDSILHANQQILREALDILDKETMFIQLILPKPTGSSNEKMVEDFTQCGAVYLSLEDLDYVGLPLAMRIKMNDRFELPDQRMEFLFTADDLPAACVYLQRAIQDLNDNSSDVYIDLETCPCIIETACLLQDDASPRVETKLSKCLEPLKHIRGVSQVDMDGPTSHYTAALVAAMTDRRRSAKETMDLIAAHTDRGDHYLLQGASRRAITEYKAGCHAIESRVFDEMETNEELIGGRFNGLLAGWYVRNPSPSWYEYHCRD